MEKVKDHKNKTFLDSFFWEIKKMKLFRILFFLFFALGGIMALGGAVPDNMKNLAKNGSFEADKDKNGLPDGWISGKGWYEKGRGGLSKIVLDKSVSRHGKNSLKFIGKNNRGIASVAIDSPSFCAGVVYELSGWIKADKLECRAEIGLDFLDKNNKWISSESTFSASEEKEWTYLKKDILIPENTAKIMLSVRTDKPNSGIVWFDEISFRKKDEKALKKSDPVSLGDTRDAISLQMGEWTVKLKLEKRILKKDDVNKIHFAIFDGANSAKDIDVKLFLNELKQPLEKIGEEYVSLISPDVSGNAFVRLQVIRLADGLCKSSPYIGIKVLPSDDAINVGFPVAVFWDALLPNENAGIPGRQNPKKMEAYVEKSLKRLKASHFNSIWGAVPFSKLIDKVKKYDMKIIVGAVPGRETIVKDSEKLKINIPAPALKTVYAKIPPNIDGKLEDPCWKNACAINKFILLNATDMAGQKTEAFVLYDEKNLYIALRCYDSRINKISKLYAKHDDPIWKDDSVEIFIDIDHTKKDYFQLAVNAIGAKLDTKWESGKSDIKWNAENWKAISFIGPDFWSVEMTVPLKSLSSKPIKKDTVWGFNIARSARSHAEYSSWAPLYHNFIQPGMFGVLTFDDKIQNKRSSGSVSGKVINTAGKPVENAIVTAGRFVTLTNSKGEFSFESLPEGECVISAGGYNYEPVSGGVVVNKNGVVLPPFILENAMHLTLSPSKTYDLVKENIDALKNNKNSILGYYMADEPPVCAADNLALVNRFYKSFDSDIPALSCFLGLPAIKLLCQKVKPSVLLIDVYPLREDSPVGDLKMRGHHLPEMDMTEYIDKARDCLPGRPLWVAVQAFGSAMNGKPHFRLPEPVEIRAMVYSAIAHGAKGIIYFLYESKKAGAKKGESLIGLIGPDGKATPNWKEVGRINKELNFLSPLLLNLNIRKNIASASENADVQTFCDSENNIYLILVNRDVTAAKEISVKIENEKLGGFSQIIEFVGKNKISHNLQDNHIVFKALLDPGDGKVFQLIKTAK